MGSGWVLFQFNLKRIPLGLLHSNSVQSKRINRGKGHRIFEQKNGLRETPLGFRTVEESQEGPLTASTSSSIWGSSALEKKEDSKSPNVNTPFSHKYTSKRKGKNSSNNSSKKNNKSTLSSNSRRILIFL